MTQERRIELEEVAYDALHKNREEALFLAKCIERTEEMEERELEAEMNLHKAYAN